MSTTAEMAERRSHPANIPIWAPSAITLQPIRAGFPCFGVALAGYVEATRTDDVEKNRPRPPTPLPDTLAGWARMPPGRPGSRELTSVLDRLQTHVRPGLDRLAELSHLGG